MDKKKKKMQNLLCDLMGVLHDEKHRNLSQNQKTIAVITFLQDALRENGHRRSRIMNSGYLGEAFMAATNEMKINDKPHGPDMTDDEGKNVEAKISYVDRGGRMSINLSPPKRVAGVDYNTNLLNLYVSRGPVTCRHEFENKKNEKVQLVYTFEPEFVVLFMLKKKITKGGVVKDNINMGGTSCSECGRTNKVFYYLQLQEEWKKDKQHFDDNKFEMEIATKCPVENCADIPLTTKINVGPKVEIVDDNNNNNNNTAQKNTVKKKWFPTEKYFFWPEFFFLTVFFFEKLKLKKNIYIKNKT